MSDDLSARFYLVRGKPELVENSIVGIGWSDYNFAELDSAEAAIAAINAGYGVGRRANQIRRFFAIAEGDYIVVPSSYVVAIGRAVGGLIFDPNEVVGDRANQRRVVFPRDAQGRVRWVPRDALQESLQRRLRVQGMTVNDLGEFGAELRQVYDQISGGGDYSWSGMMAARIDQESKEFQAQLLKNIQHGHTNLKTGGIGLENLVRELLEIRGYAASVLSKRAFHGKADADVVAARGDRFATTNLLVQVKHHQGFSGEQGLAQLGEISRRGVEGYEDHQLVFCTSASVSDELRKRAEASNVSVIDGEDLVAEIHDCLSQLSPETKRALGVGDTPRLFDGMG